MESAGDDLKCLKELASLSLSPRLPHRAEDTLDAHLALPHPKPSCDLPVHAAGMLTLYEMQQHARAAQPRRSQSPGPQMGVRLSRGSLDLKLSFSSPRQPVSSFAELRRRAQLMASVKLGGPASEEDSSSAAGRPADPAAKPTGSAAPAA